MIYELHIQLKLLNLTYNLAFCAKFYIYKHNNGCNDFLQIFFF